MQSRQKRKKILNKPENIFLIFATVLGLAFALIQPLFIEPDSSYHFDHAMYISNTVVDRAKIGFPAEDYQSAPIPFNTVSEMKKEGRYFKNFFETKLPLISQKDANPRVSANYGTKNNLAWYNDVMHIIPALGVKVGYMLYPSVGSMVITARLFNLIFFLLSMFFIIKKLKIYQLVFTVISLTPTVIQFATSLSYDCYTYVVFAWLFATLLNMAVKIKKNEEIAILDFTRRLIFPSFAILFSKANSKLLYVLLLAMLFVLVGKKMKVSLNKLQIGIGTVVIVFTGICVFFIKYHAQLHLIASKFFYTFLEPYYTVLTTEVISGTNTNGMPAWFFPIQFTALILLMLSYNKEVVPRWFTWLSTVLSILNLFGVLFTFSIDPSFTEHVITGPQGRYFTMFILLLVPVFTLLAQKIRVESGAWLRRSVILVSVLALLLNLTITSVKFYKLKLPADEYRSGIVHYIFK